MNIITRFAPSPTGPMHVGNARCALLNFLYAKKHNGKFILRIDDTDEKRNIKEGIQIILDSLKWLKITPSETFRQSQRKNIYNKFAQKLIKEQKVYPCYETQEELKKIKEEYIKNNKPFLYDRKSMFLSEKEIKNYNSIGRKPYYRFFLKNQKIVWQDGIKGKLSFETKNISDPVVIKTDGSITYLLSSVIDDIEMNITDIIRGEDHTINTAIQILLLESLKHNSIRFSHLSLLKMHDKKISKRQGNCSIEDIKKDKIHYMSLCSFLTTIGSKKNVQPYKNLTSLINDFSLLNYSKSTTQYDIYQLYKLNSKILKELDYSEIIAEIKKFYPNINFSEDFWNNIKVNITKIEDIKHWHEIIYDYTQRNKNQKYKNLIQIAISCLPSEINKNTWLKWTNTISKQSGLEGKELYLPLRRIITESEKGPKMQDIIPMLSRKEILKRLSNTIS